MKIYNILLKSAEKGINFQHKTGFMPAGHNGPYFHPETPIRNTCHWLILFLKAYKISNDKKFLKASNKCISYILENRPKYNYKHRTFKGRDSCNGLIGPAWTIEALLIASKELNRNDLSDLAKDIFLMHKFNKKLGLWHRREINGKTLSIDWTFNHQLWFAAVGSMFNKNMYPEIHNLVKIFLNKLNYNFNIYKNGLIQHPVAKYTYDIVGLKRILSKLKLKLTQNNLYIHKSIGYHQFNLYAFAIIKENYSNLNFWKSNKLKKALNFIKTNEYELGLINNKYGYDYNVAGIEIAYIMQTFEACDKNCQEKWILNQLNRNFNFDDNLLNKNTDDPRTLAARLYEATRLKNLKLNITEDNNFPFVSIIVPVYNDQERIKFCIKSLLQQTYPKEKYEIIIIDNNSKDNTLESIKKFPVRFFQENKIQSSYAARNMGIKNSKGEILAFTDSDCISEKDWLLNGIKSLIINKAHLIGGEVNFLFSNKKTAAEMFDSITNINNKQSILSKESAKTANLITYKYIFEDIGLFINNVKSGGDVEWTKRAVNNGYKIKYCHNSVVNHPARKLKELLKKNYRVGTGTILVWKSRGKSKLWIICACFSFLTPIIWFKFYKNYKKNKKKNIKYKLLKMMLIAYLCKLATLLGIISTLYKRNTK